MNWTWTPKPVASDFFTSALFVALRVLQQVEVGDAGEVDVPLAGEHAGREAVLGAVEAVGEDAVLVGLAVAVRVPDQPDALAVLGVLAELVLLVHRDAVGDGAAREVVVEPRLAAGVGDALRVPERLGDEAPALLVEGERDRVRQRAAPRPRPRPSGSCRPARPPPRPPRPGTFFPFCAACAGSGPSGKNATASATATKSGSARNRRDIGKCSEGG